MNKFRRDYVIQANLKKFFGYFLRGCLLVLPTVLTIYLIYIIIVSVDEIITANFTKMPAGTGFIIIVLGLTFIGMIGGSYLLSPFKQLFKMFVERTPGVKIVYNAIKDFLEALVGEKKKFNNPVLVKVNHDPEVWQFGFVTQESLSNIQLDDYVSVYCPKSYGFLGDLIVVKADNVKAVDGMNSFEVMKFVLSGGVASDNSDDKK